MVTGATTPLGLGLIDELLAAPDVSHVLALGREDSSPISDERLVYRAVDFTHPREVRAVVCGDAAEQRIDVVIGMMQHRRSRDRGSRVHAQNVDATRNLVLACTGHPTIRRFVYRSFGEVYALRGTTPDLLDEDSPLDFEPTSPQWLRDRVESDLAVCAHLGGTPEIIVLRLAEVFAPGSGSQLWDYLGSRVCLRPAGYDPMLNVLSFDDAVAALLRAARAAATGIFNIPGIDTLPLSRAIAECRRADLPVPGPLLPALYELRHVVLGSEFRYRQNAGRFHVGGVLDGSRAARLLGYEPRTHVRWPRPPWSLLLDRLAHRVQDDTPAAR
jgi:nucleoside-diphosphate-sugar epimerase